jgi:hypothetical protein
MTDGQRSRLTEAIKTLGASEVARRMELSTEAVLRLAIGAGSHAGTELLAQQRLERLEAAK